MAKENLIKKIADPQNIKLLLKETKNNVFSRADHEKQDQADITAIIEKLKDSLLSIASKLLASEHNRLHHL
jgi:hypothetical protein